MKTIAITGSFGSGKTTVLKFVRSLRVPTIDCDAIVSGLYKDKRVQQKLRHLFGTANKKEIASIAFSSPSKRKKLERLLHPLVWKRVQAKISSLRKHRNPIAFVEVPLLFEASWQNRFDFVLFVKASKKKCLHRLVPKKLSRKDFLLRWNSQIPPKKKIKRAHYTIDNSKAFASTKRQARQLVLELSK